MANPTNPADKMIAAVMRLLVESGAGDEAIAHVTRALPGTVATALGRDASQDGALDLLPALEGVIEHAVTRAVQASLATQGVATRPTHVDRQASTIGSKRPAKQKVNILIAGKPTSVGVSAALLEELTRLGGSRRKAVDLVQAKVVEFPENGGNRSQWTEAALWDYLKLETTPVQQGSAH